MGRRKDAERRKRREQRMAERLQQTKSNELNDSINENDQESDKHTVMYHEASAESITGENLEITTIKNSDTSERMYINVYEYFICN